ncbi:hypothetical protein PLICRDRAFT_45370 [Plicaturopsis crispa FD-325 SS-3]|uniref:Calcineurin-like phosphoesterase domain-containing protein n=1 Tax=Plicaturopsis crispa FD-325 SS-3 TaxID=944288 RepID=A0A0C9T7D0_PLICR|nr:hypothetical protein PLICRDRAFT_45370 [Plicaturopsis crispa FD-325 SS-3]
MAGVTDEQGRWSGDIDTFVQTGDIIDRGDDTIPLFEYMETLRDQAHAVGGTVVSHLGNHEWMNAIGDWRYVYPSEIKTFGSVTARQEELATGRIGRAWAANYSTASRVPLHPSLGPVNAPYPSSSASSSALSHSAISFVHGGLSPAYPDLTPFPSAINTLAASLLDKLQHRAQFPPPHPPAPYPGLPPGTTEAEAGLMGGIGPVWYRGWALGSEEDVCREVGEVLERTGVRRMVMGHTPDFKEIVSRCDGRILVIDTGISHAYGGALSALSIEYTLTPVSSAPDVQKTDAPAPATIWTERELVRAVYLDRTVVLADTTQEIEGDFSAWH